MDYWWSATYSLPWLHPYNLGLIYFKLVWPNPTQIWAHYSGWVGVMFRVQIWVQPYNVPPRSISQNQGKYAVLPVLPVLPYMAPLLNKPYLNPTCFWGRVGHSGSRNGLSRVRLAFRVQIWVKFGSGWSGAFQTNFLTAIFSQNSGIMYG